MLLTNEWKKRIDMWINELPEHFYVKIKNFPVQMFTTMDMLDYKTASKQRFHSASPGEKWGRKWEYGWFKTKVIIPHCTKGKRVVLKMDEGCENTVYVNGEIVGAIDKGRKEVTLSGCAAANEEYDILIEAYAGHGARISSPGPVPQDIKSIPEPPEFQCMIKEAEIGIWEEEAYQLWIDAVTLKETMECADKKSLRASQIASALKEFTYNADFELDYDSKISSFKKAREVLKPFLDCKNGSTAPVMYAYGHSHIDVVWLWPLNETKRKIARTFANQITLMEEYPEYIFLQSQALLYDMAKKLYPALYEKIREKVKEGRFIPEGGMWVEPDMNISSGESIIRQIYYGKKFFKDEFGVDCKILWLPDVFGYSGALPQILKGCKIDYFTTHKLFWAYNGFEQFPYNQFMWEGIDGTKILSYIYNDYNAKTNPKKLNEYWNKRVQTNGVKIRPLPFGHGDGGGGATRDHIEFALRAKDLEGVPKVKISHPASLFEDIEKEGLPKEKYTGELYFATHRGTYTSQAKTKKGNRKSEIALREAEFLCAVSNALNGIKVPEDDMEYLWKKVLLNQFHDILPGSSINRAYKEAEQDYNEVLKKAEGIISEKAVQIAGSTDKISVFNSLNWKRKALVRLPEGAAGITDNNGSMVCTQKTGNKIYAAVDIPSCGYASFEITDKPAGGNDRQCMCRAQIDSKVIENNVIRLKFNGKGELTSIFDKVKDIEYAKGMCNSFKMYKDVPTGYDAWDIDSMYEKTPVSLNEDAVFENAESGQLFASFTIRRKLNNSDMQQVVRVYRDSIRVDFETKINWQESHKMLKVNFPVNIYANELTSEIQFGHIKRPNHKSRLHDAERFEVSNHKWSALTEGTRGFAVLNDSKYGVSAYDNSINLTLLKSPLAPDMTADKGIQEFTYSIYFWDTPFEKCDVIRQSYELNIPPLVINGGNKEISFFETDNDAVIIETIKPAYDGNGIIARMYESKKTHVRCCLKTALDVNKFILTDMLENDIEKLYSENNSINIDFRPFEVKTIRIVL